MVKAGDIVTSRQGHDEGRFYVVVAVPNEDFCLVCDGHYRKLDNPKTKRVKHLSWQAHSLELAERIASGSLCDANLVCELKKHPVDKPN